jgi:four helix bundle protein
MPVVCFPSISNIAPSWRFLVKEIFNVQVTIFIKYPMSHSTKSFDLEERTARFGERVIIFCRQIPKDYITSPLVNQLVRSATSVGANYMEANGASSRKDFTNKICICRKEIHETKHWLRMLSVAAPQHKEVLRLIWIEAQELTLIFQKIIQSLKMNQ